MRLLTMNTLQGPLRLEATQIEVRRARRHNSRRSANLNSTKPFSDISSRASRCAQPFTLTLRQWDTLREAADTLGVTLPEFQDHPEFLKALHHILFDIHIIEGSLNSHPIREGRVSMRK